MAYDKSAEADIRGINIQKLVVGFGEISMIMKRHVKSGKTSNREIRWYRKGLSLATAMNKLDVPDTTGITASQIANVSFGARPFVVEQGWERQTSHIRKYFVESPWITLEDIKDADPDVFGENVRALVEGVGWQVDRRIYDVLTEATVSGTPNPTNVNTTAATDGWATTATANPILDLLIGKRKIIVAGYNPEGCITLMNPLEYQNLVNYLISVKGSSIPSFASDKVKSGVVMEVVGCRILPHPNATADWVIQWVANRACTWKSFMPLKSAIVSEEGIGKKIRVWEEGEAILTDPLAVHIISGAS